MMSSRWLICSHWLPLLAWKYNGLREGGGRVRSGCWTLTMWWMVPCAFHFWILGFADMTADLVNPISQTQMCTPWRGDTNHHVVRDTTAEKKHHWWWRDWLVWDLTQIETGVWICRDLCKRTKVENEEVNVIGCRWNTHNTMPNYLVILPYPVPTHFLLLCPFHSTTTIVKW